MKGLSKDAYYFSHDSNAHKAPKILKLRSKFGWEGYGIFWAIVETLREQENYSWKADEKELLSFSFANGEPIVNQVIDYCIEIELLIVTDDGFLQSESLNRRMEIREEKRRKKVEAGKKGALSRWKNSNANSSANDSAINTPMAEDGKGKERKGKERERKEKGKETTQDISLQIENLRQRYSSSQLEVIDNYLEMIRHTRTSAQIADSVILKMYHSWDKYPPICVEYGLKTHTDNPEHHSKKENYTLGIVRGTTADEAYKKLNRQKKDNVVDMYKSDSVDAPKHLLGW